MRGQERIKAGTHHAMLSASRPHEGSEADQPRWFDALGPWPAVPMRGQEIGVWYLSETSYQCQPSP